MDISWELTSENRLEIQPATGCSRLVGFPLILTAFFFWLPLAQTLVELVAGAADPLTASAIFVLLVQLALGLLLFLAGWSLAFGRRSILITGDADGEVEVVQDWLLWRRRRRFPASEFQAVAVRPHNASLPASVTPRISHFTHDVLLLPREGEPLLLDHSRWENEEEALGLANAVAGLLHLPVV